MYFLGLAATILGIIGAIPYLLDTYKKKTKPHRIAWLIFLVLSIISFATQFSLGARPSLIFFGWFVVNNILIVSMSFRKNGGYGTINATNVISFALAILSIVLWKTTNSPLTALLCVLLAESIGSVLIVIKAYRFPKTETIFMWQLGSIAGLLNILAVGKLDIQQLLAPVLLFLFNVAIVVAIMLGKKRLSN